MINEAFNEDRELLEEHLAELESVVVPYTEALLCLAESDPAEEKSGKPVATDSVADSNAGCSVDTASSCVELGDKVCDLEMRVKIMIRSLGVVVEKNAERCALLKSIDARNENGHPLAQIMYRFAVDRDEEIWDSIIMDYSEELCGMDLRFGWEKVYGLPALILDRDVPEEVMLLGRDMRRCAGMGYHQAAVSAARQLVEYVRKAIFSSPLAAVVGGRVIDYGACWRAVGRSRDLPLLPLERRMIDFRREADREIHRVTDFACARKLVCEALVLVEAAYR